MWSRVVEAMLGCWLLISPFIFRYSGDDVTNWSIDLVGGTLIILLALASFWHPLRKAHLGLLVVGIGLIISAYATSMGHSATPAAQNHLTLGLLLLMFGVIPSDASAPPAGWDRYASGVNPGGVNPER